MMPDDAPAAAAPADDERGASDAHEAAGTATKVRAAPDWRLLWGDLFAVSPLRDTQLEIACLVNTRDVVERMVTVQDGMAVLSGYGTSDSVVEMARLRMTTETAVYMGFEAIAQVLSSNPGGELREFISNTMARIIKDFDLGPATVKDAEGEA